jgi:serine/threonine protein kinase
VAQLTAGLSGKFQIVREIGVGGMGRVFLAEQISVGNRRVALKVLHKKLLDDKEFLLRFKNEAASLGAINHPNVVTIYDSGQGDDGTPYIAMEYRKGETLAQTLQQRGPLLPTECAEIIQQVARGLDAAHKLGIIHRDLKPDNIFLPRIEEGEVEVKVGDFGIAKPRESTTHTEAGKLMGTLQYMSFEQASGMPSENLDPRSDLNSLAIITYEMLTARQPYHSDTLLGVLRARLNETPPPLQTVNPDLADSSQIENVVMKALARERDYRHSSVMEFAQEFAMAVRAIGAAHPKTIKVEPPFGTEPSLKLSPESLAASQQALDATEQRLKDTTKILLNLIALEGDIPGHKTCGCERCSSCTIRVSGLVDEWLQKTQYKNTDLALAQLGKFVGFPRALVRVVLACQRAIQSAKPADADQAEGVLVAQIEGLCKEADHRYTEGRKDFFLSFSRVVRALDLLLPDLELGVLGKSPEWDKIKKRIETLKDRSTYVEGNMVKSDFSEDRWLDPRQKTRTGMKRVEGGGYLRAAALPNMPDAEPAYVIDFSKEHILVVTKDHISGDQTGCEFFPTQRELPFCVDIRPVEHGKRASELIQSTVKADSKLHKCGEHYQLLEILRIEPRYYYLALCARSLSKHDSVAGDRLVHTHDWPKPPAFTEHR